MGTEGPLALDCGPAAGTLVPLVEEPPEFGWPCSPAVPEIPAPLLNRVRWDLLEHQRVLRELRRLRELAVDRPRPGTG